MSYIVTLRDGATHKLGDEDGLSLRTEWEESKRPFPARLGNDSVLSSQIVGISKEQMTQADWFTDEVIDASKRIEAKDRCRAQYSIQREINNIAKEEGGKHWTRLIRDEAWREETRLKLRAMREDWCDYKAGECVCEAEYVSNGPQHNSARVYQP